jgi:cytochrome c
MISRILCVALASGALLLAFGPPGEEDRGKDLFARRCSGCHAPDLIKEGPPLRGIYGRKAGSVPGFVYSDALKGLGIRWDEATLDRWLTNPDALAPDTDMDFRLADGGERRAVIAYLKSLRNL